VTARNRDPKLEIQILGGSVGESIIIRTPDGRWGVVDCYSPRTDAPSFNPTLARLASRGVKELDFLCLTHPHADHYRGMTHLVEHLKVHEFWHFDSLTPEHTQRLFAMTSGAALAVDDTEGWDDAQELIDLFEKVRRRRIERCLLSDIKLLRNVSVPLEKGSTSFEIWSLAPPSRFVNAYTNNIFRFFEKNKSTPASRPLKLRHNIISAALLIKFGQTQIVLGGDVEIAAWKLALRQCNTLRLGLHADAVKVSHHGSLTGFYTDVWTQFSSRAKTFSVITPFSSQSLPTKTALKNMSQFSTDIAITSPGPTNNGRDYLFEITTDFAEKLAILEELDEWLPLKDDGNRGSCNLFCRSDETYHSTGHNLHYFSRLPS
jgi:hypothetical protein